MSMEKEKIEQFFRLLDGISEREWETLKHQADRVYRMAAMENTPKLNEYGIQYLTDETDKIFSIAREADSIPKHAADEV